MSKVKHPLSDYEVEIYNEGHQDGSVGGAKRERERIIKLVTDCKIINTDQKYFLLALIKEEQK
jgi:hypothetical protein